MNTLAQIAQSGSQLSSKPVLRTTIPLNSIEMAILHWIRFAEGITGGVKYQITPKNKPVIKELIKYAMGDQNFYGSLGKGLCVLGPTGTGKTLLFGILAEIIKSDEIIYYRYGQPRTFRFKTITSRELCSLYASKGFEALDWFASYNILFIDDIGAEQERTRYYGTELDVVAYIVEERSRQKRITHYTGNLTPTEINERYGSRVHSRIMGETNLIILKDKDFRINN